MLIVAVAAATGVLAPARSWAQTPAPDAAPRVPVLLVPGWLDDAEELAPVRARLLEDGWPAELVSGVTFTDPVGSNAVNAFQVARAVDALRTRTGADRIDVVAHSMGGLAVREYLRAWGDGAGVRRAVYLGTPHRGTLTATLAWGESAREMVPGSDFLDRLNGHGIPSGLEVLAIRTPVDLNVVPSSSAMLPGARNVEICCPSHHGLLSDEQTLDEVVAFLGHGAERLSQPDESIPLRTDAGRSGAGR
jgi:triacylglycerol esterase/lipase EstA (alpha/beta hydrolase family)